MDVDPESVATTDENLARNQIESVETRTGSLDAVSGAFDLVLANIEAGVLSALASGFPRASGGRRDGGPVGHPRRSSGGRSGAPSPAVGLRLEARRDEDEWAALRLRRP